MRVSRIARVVALVSAIVPLTLVGSQPANAASCWYCNVYVDDAMRTERMSSGVLDFGMLFTLRLGYVPSNPVNVTFATAPGTAPAATAGVDYTPTSGTVQFGAGKTTAYVFVQIKDDTTANEPNETFKLNLLSIDDGASIADGSALGTIIDDDPPRFFVLDAQGREGSGSLSFSVRLSGPLASTASVAYTTGNGTATAPNDYQARSGTLVFSPGQTTKTVAVPIVDDFTFEEGPERVNLTLSGPVGAGIARSGIGTILDNDTIH